MKQNKLETLLYSAAGVAVMFAIIVALNLIFGVFKTRVDMTEERLHTLSPGTVQILKKLDSPIEIRFYASQTRMPSAFKPIAQHVEDLLAEFKQVAGNNIEIKKFDPQPDTEAEDLAALDGIQGQPLQTGDTIYLGVAISLDPLKATLPFISPDQDRLLEYDLAREISKVLSTNKPVIGVMSPLPVLGMKVPPMMRMQMPQGGQDPWQFVTELKQRFEVKQVEMTAESIDDDIKVLIVLHPKEIKDGTQYALDQFVLRGGKLIAMVDANCIVDKSNQNPQMGFQMPSAPSNLDKLFKAWGVTFEGSKVVADMNYARQLQGPGGAPQVMPSYLFITSAGINKEEVVCSQLDEILMPLAGSFTGTPATGLKQSVLLKTTKDSQLVETFMASMNGQKIVDDFKSSGTEYNLAIRLSGKFKTAFPDGKPESKSEDADKDKKPEDKKADGLKEGKADNNVVLIADADFLSEPFCGQSQTHPFFRQKVFSPRFGNLTFLQNLVEQMAGDDSLIGSRSRASTSRPFEEIKKMQKAANERFQAEIKKLEEEQQEAQKRLNELQQAKKDTGQQRFILSAEQQAEIAKFTETQAAARKKLRQVRKDLRREIEWTQNKHRWANILVMPVTVAMVGILLAVVRKQKTKAK